MTNLEGVTEFFQYDENNPDFLKETAGRLAQSLGLEKDTVLKKLQATPFEAEALLADPCLNFCASVANLLPSYIYPDIDPDVPNKTVAETARILMPVKKKNLYPPPQESFETVTVKLANLRGQYMIAQKLNPEIANQPQYLPNRIRMGIVIKYLYSLHRHVSCHDVPPELIMTLSRHEREELKLITEETPLSKILTGILEEITPLVTEAAKKKLETQEKERDQQLSNLTDSGIHPKMAERIVNVKEEKNLDFPTSEELLALSLDTSRINTLARITAGEVT